MCQMCPIWPFPIPTMCPRAHPPSPVRAACSTSKKRKGRPSLSGPRLIDRFRNLANYTPSIIAMQILPSNAARAASLYSSLILSRR